MSTAPPSHENAHAALLGPAAAAALRTPNRGRVFAVARNSPVERIDGIPVGPATELSAAELSELQAALLDPATWQWDVSTRHRPLADTLLEVTGPGGRVLVGLDRRGGKLGVVRDGRLHVADIAPNSPGTAILVRLAQRAVATEG
jgi:hypothetical protein